MESKELSALLDKLHGRHEPEQYCDFCELIKWAQSNSYAEVWEQCPRGDWLIWLCGSMAGETGWPARSQIVLATCAVAETVLKHAPEGEERPRESIEIACKWVAGEATIEQLHEAVHAAITTYARAAAYATITEYAAYGTDASAFATDAAAVAREKALREAADIVRQTLKAPGTLGSLR